MLIMLTQSDTDEVLEPAIDSGPTLNINGIDFQEFYNITIIGPGSATNDLTGNNSSVYYSTAEGVYFKNCHFQSGYAGVAYAKDGTFVDCLFTGCFVGVYGVGSANRPTVINCVAVSGGNGFTLVSAYNTLAIAGKRGFQNSNIFGCATAGGEYGYYTTSGNSAAGPTTFLLQQAQPIKLMYEVVFHLVLPIEHFRKHRDLDITITVGNNQRFMKHLQIF